MIKNNIELDVKVKFIDNSIMQAHLAEKVGTFSPNANRIIKKQEGMVNKALIQMLKVLGCDIELMNVKREVN